MCHIQLALEWTGDEPWKGAYPAPCRERFLIDNLLVRIHFIILMITWTGLAPWEFEFPFLGSLTSTFLVTARTLTLASHTRVSVFPLLLDCRSKSAAYRDKSREWNVSKQKWNLC